jgi:MFS family permease
MSSHRPIISISLITAACLIGDSMLYIVLPVHWQEMGLSSLWQVGIILSMNRLIRLPLNPLVSTMYRYLSARAGILIAVFLAVITTAAYGYVTSFAMFIVLRCLWGLAWTFLRLGAYFTILDYAADDNRGKCMGQYNGLYRLGSLAGMLFGGILADICGIRNTALVFALITLLCLPFVFKYIPSSAKGMVAEQSRQEIHFSIFHHPDVFTILLVGMVMAMIYQGIFTSTISYLIQLQRPDPLVLAGAAIGAASLGGVVQAVRWAWEPWLAPWFGSLSDSHLGRLPVLCGSTFVAAMGFACISLRLPDWLWFAILMVLQLTATSLTTIADTLAADAAIGSAKVKIMTTYSLLIDLGAALGPMIAYFSNQYIQAHAAYWGASLLLFVVTFHYFRRWRQESC